MTADEFRALVKKMREYQKNYFAYKTTASLKLSKTLEAQVDSELAGRQEITF